MSWINRFDNWSDAQLHELRQVFVNAGLVPYYEEPVDIGSAESKERLAASLDQLGDVAAAAPDKVIDEAKNKLGGAAGVLTDLSLDFVRGLGGAIVDGIDGAYDAVRAKLRGKEPDVIAGFTVAAITILTVVFLYNGAKNAKDVF